jgi:hypothetical protein
MNGSRCGASIRGESKGSQKDAEGALTDTVRNEGKGLLSSVEKEGVVV